MSPFRLAGLLRLRSVEEEALESKLAHANRGLRSTRERRDEARASASTLHLPVLARPETLRAVHVARAAAAAMVSELDAAEAMQVHERDDIQGQHQKAKKSRTVLEKLEARHISAELGEELRDEQAALDEVAGAQATRATGGQLWP